MYLGNQKRNGIIELEIVNNIPDTERFDADINSPVSYDDIFESISLNKWQYRKYNTGLDIPNNLRIRLLDLLRFYGINEFGDIESVSSDKYSNKNKEINHKDKKFNLGIFNIVPPFISRLMKYNVFEQEFSNYFEFGSNLTPPSSYLVSKYRLVKTLGPCDNPWYRGCKKLILIGIPSFLSINDIKETIIRLSDEKKHRIVMHKDKEHNENVTYNTEDNKTICADSNNSGCDTYDSNINVENNTNTKPEKTVYDNPNNYCKQQQIEEFGILKYTNMFTTDNRDYYINNLYKSQNTIVKGRMNMALLEFNNEHEALNFWASLCTGSFECYGHVLTSIPDPSGLRILAEGMLTVFSPKCIPLFDSIKSVNDNILKADYSNVNESQLKLLFPIIGSFTSFESLKSHIEDITSKDRKDENIDIIIKFDENKDLLTVTTNNLKTIELLNNRIFQHCSFKVPVDFNSNIKLTTDDINIINVAMFLIDDMLCEPVIIEGSYDLHPIKHKTIDFEINEKGKEYAMTDSSASNYHEEDSEPAGFLFKKFEELREALKNDLDPNNHGINFNKNSNKSNNNESDIGDNNKTKNMSSSNVTSEKELYKTKDCNEHINESNPKEKGELEISDFNNKLPVSIAVKEDGDANLQVECHENKKQIIESVCKNDLELNKKDESTKYSDKTGGCVTTESERNEKSTDEMCDVKVDMKMSIIENEKDDDVEMKEYSVSNSNSEKKVANIKKDKNKKDANINGLEVEKVDIFDDNISEDIDEDTEEKMTEQNMSDDYYEKDPSPVETQRGRRGRKRRAENSTHLEKRDTKVIKGTSNRGKTRGGRGRLRATRGNKKK